MFIVAALGCAFAGTEARAASLTCQPADGGAAFRVSSVQDVSGAAVKAQGAEQCDQVYRIDGQRYELGGCNRHHVGVGSGSEGSPIGHFHPRLALNCR